MKLDIMYLSTYSPELTSFDKHFFTLISLVTKQSYGLQPN